MKLFKVKTRIYKEKIYYKYRIGSVPAEIIKSAGFKPGTKLSAKASRGKIIITRKKAGK